ncbi:mitochondrial fission factor homolog A isoform X2 [Chanos chanos]|uniref:Mitochondrial fission factor n=1 Tax=Chanos chanos TaxID=29144 RepID=A0A6J2VEL9_CHACN|nr:mitochondrial fission factor homolog A-like isoform X2 [Chanos chanos]
MTEAGFSPSAEMAEINRIHYELEYTEGISQRMRIPERLKIAPGSSEDQLSPVLEAPHSTLMQVPERIVVAGDSNDARFSRPSDLDLIQSTPMETVELKAPPRVLTLNERPLDFLEPEQPTCPATPQVHTLRSRRERSVSENSAIRHNGSANKYDAVSPSAGPPVRVCPPLVTPEDGQNLYSASGVLSYIQSTTRRAYQQVLEVLDDSQHRVCLLDTSVESTPDDSSLMDAASLRRQIIKLNRRLQLLELENRERAKREVVMYSVTVAFWLVNTWIWLRR